MKRLLSIVLALSLVGTSAAFAKGPGYGPQHGGYAYGYSGHHRGSNNAAAAVGFGLLALGVIGIIASQQNRNYDRGYYAPVPAYGYGGYGYQGSPYTYNGYNGSGYGYPAGPYGYR